MEGSNVNFLVLLGAAFAAVATAQYNYYNGGTMGLGGMAGGIGYVQPASAANQDFLYALQGPIRTQFIQYLRFTPNRFDLDSFATQVVAGTNYYAKVHLGNGQYCVLRIFRSLQNQWSLTGYMAGVPSNMPLSYILQSVQK